MTRSTAVAAGGVDCTCKGPTVGVAGTYKVTVNESERGEAESCLGSGGRSFPSLPVFFNGCLPLLPELKELSAL